VLLPGTLLVGLPLLGVLLAGKSLSPYLEFPPQTYFVAHAPFSWPVFTGLAVVALFLVAVLFFSLYRAERRIPPRLFPFPLWGWWAALVLVAAWVLAWSRFDWFASWQAYTFTPLWLCYILVINALSYRRQGTCLLTGQHHYLFLLFPFSALFWWYFEFLNRFVQNWRYVGIDSFGAAEYAIHSTLCFSTVLPAVVSTMELLSTYVADAAGTHRGYVACRRHWAWPLLAISIASLGGLGVWPDYLFPLLWLAPMLLIIALQLLWGEPVRIFSGRILSICIPALAALICGLFWEMWNFYSLAHWTYAIPYVDRFHIFEMPLLGYAGYLPFGLECAVIADIAARLDAAPPVCRT